MSEELKPCPFCGGPVKLEEAHTTNDRLLGIRRWWGVVCRNTTNLGGTCCIEQVPSASKEAAVSRWNMRAAQPAASEPSSRERATVDRSDAPKEIDEALLWRAFDDNPKAALAMAIRGLHRLSSDARTAGQAEPADSEVFGWYIQIENYAPVFLKQSAPPDKLTAKEALEIGWQPLYTAQPAPQEVPQGWKLVPVEPTPEMKEAAMQIKRTRLLDSVKAIRNGEDPETAMVGPIVAEWKAMLAAAPSTPQPVGINGLTEAETAASASVMGLTRADECRVNPQYSGPANCSRGTVGCTKQHNASNEGPALATVPLD